MQTESAVELIARFEALKGLRTAHQDVWRRCFNLTYPMRGSGFNGDVYTAERAQSKAAQILDSVGTDSVRTLAAAIMSGLTPSNSRWFGLDVGTESEDEKRWLDDAAQALWENIHMANFDGEGLEAVIDCICAGWFALYIDEDQENGGFHFEQWPLAGVYGSASKSGGLIDTVYRTFTMTAQQAVDMFGDELSEQTKKLALKKPDEKVEFTHCIKPRALYVTNPRLANNLPFASLHIECKAKKIVRESGYHEFPVVFPRWMKIPDSVYGIGPVFDAIPDLNMLNDLKRMELAAADLAIAGMWIAEDDGVLNPRTVKVGPRKIIIANSVDSMKPLQTGSNFKLSDTMVTNLQAAIRKILMADVLQPQDGPAMTATEVHVRMNLVRQLLGPVYGRFQAEYLQPLINRCFGLAYRAGVFGEAPESLADREFTVKYISPLARAQKLEDVTAIERLYGNIAQIAPVKPEVLDLVDDDEAIRVLSAALGVPHKVVRKTEAVETIRRDRAEQQKAAQQEQMAMQMQQAAGEEAVKKVVNNG
jgi:Bacteriophage head to tail connecting protein